MRVDEDALAVSMAAARMDCKALEVPEDLDVVFRDSDTQLLVTMDMRGTVVIALDVPAGA